MPEIGTRRLRLFVGAGPTEMTDAVSNVRIISGKKDTDFMSFAEAATGGAREYKLALTLKQDTTADSLWDEIWTAAGTDVAIEVWPNGQNTTAPTTPTATYPKISGTATILEPDGDLLGGQASESSTARFVTSVEWPFLAKPVRAIS